MEKEKFSRRLAPTLKLVLLGFLLALIATYVSFALQMGLFEAWQGSRGGPDLVPDMFGIPFIDFLLFLVLFSGLVPFVYADHRKTGEQKPMESKRLAVIAVFVALVPGAAMAGIRRDLLFAVISGPLIVLAAVGVFVLTWIANREQTRGDGGTGGARP